MRRSILFGSAAFLAALAMPAGATTVHDAEGDFLPTFSGTHADDLDVTRFTVGFDSVASLFNLSWTLAGDVDPSAIGLYVVGVNTGTGVAAPFADVGAPNVKFNQVVAVQKTGTGVVTGPAGGPLAAGAITISGKTVSVDVPLDFLPSTGFDPLHYGFNLWPRTASGTNDLISDFAPNDALISAAPEPDIWTVMILGFGLAGARLRSRPRNASPTGTALPA